MNISTTRFGAVEIDPDDILLFPAGLLAFEDCRHWVLLADADNDTVAWLQSVTRAEVAMAVVSPRRFVADYQLRVSRGELAPLQLEMMHEAYVLAITSKHDEALTLNLKAPIVVNLQLRLGRQVVCSDDQPLQLTITPQAAPLRKSA